MSRDYDAAKADLMQIIRTVTDQWDEPLDEVHDVPQIANAIISAGWWPSGDTGTKNGDNDE
jgi:hypothetical protein